MSDKTSRLFEQIKNHLESCPMDGIDFTTDSDHLLCCLLNEYDELYKEYEEKDEIIAKLRECVEKCRIEAESYIDDLEAFQILNIIHETLKELGGWE